MPMLFKFGQGFAAHPVGGTVRQHRACLLLKGDELRLQGVVFAVGDERRILHIVGAGVCVEPVYQLLHSLQCIVFHSFLSITAG